MSSAQEFPGSPAVSESPSNPLVGIMLSDMYQFTMVYALYNAGRAEEPAVFDLFFRKPPFEGQYTVFAGLSEALALIAELQFSDSDIAYLRSVMPNTADSFFEWLQSLDASQLKVYAVSEGTIVFPRIPLLRLEGPIALVQLLETPLLNLINFPSLLATNAARFRLAAGADKTLLEFGLRRAQGPDGALSASRYAFQGGFDGTSNVLAGKLFGIPVRGTHAHSFVQSYSSLDQIKDRLLDRQDIVARALAHRAQLGFGAANDGELAAFCAYALAFPDGFLALVDSYDTLHSGKCEEHDMLDRHTSRMKAMIVISVEKLSGYYGSTAEMIYVHA